MTALIVLAALTACKDDPPADSDSAPLVDSQPPGDPTCAELGLPTQPFNAEAPTAFQRWQPAGDLSVPLRDGSTWTLSEQWTGCESYLFLPHWWPISSLNNDSYWLTGVDELIARSPRNVHYFFVVAGSDAATAESLGAEMQAEVEAALVTLDEAEAAWWLERLHVVQGPSDTLPGLVGDMFGRDISLLGWGIDRAQRIRTLGYFPDVEAYNAQLNSRGEWPWEFRLYSAANEAVYFNFEAERQAALDAVDATELELFGGEVIAEYEDGSLTFPDAATMAGFDTLEIDVTMECPDRDLFEPNNCGAWDYLAHLWLLDSDGQTWLEMGRFITTYHRESRWVLDASHALAWLGEGGERTLRYSWAPSWNTQPTGVTLRLRLSNQGKGAAAAEAFPLFTGGAFSTTYNADRPPVTVEIPADAVKVELVSIATGHGGETYNCAEFCQHAHIYSIGESTWEQRFDAPGDDTGCSDTVGTGTVPNQAGTWWFGRGGWCPGRRVDPFVVDVTDTVTPGEAAVVSYEAEVRGSAPIDGVGNAELRSWLVVHR